MKYAEAGHLWLGIIFMYWALSCAVITVASLKEVEIRNKKVGQERNSMLRKDWIYSKILHIILNT